MSKIRGRVESIAIHLHDSRVGDLLIACSLVITIVLTAWVLASPVNPAVGPAPLGASRAAPALQHGAP